MLNDNIDDEGNYYQYFLLVLYSAEPWITMRFFRFSVGVPYTNMLLWLLYKWKHLFCSYVSTYILLRRSLIAVHPMRNSGICVILHVCSFFNPSTYASSDVIISLHLLSIFLTTTDKTSLIQNKTISFQTCLVSSYYLLVEGNRYVRRNRKNWNLIFPYAHFFIKTTSKLRAVYL